MPARVKGPRNLCPAERAIGEQSPILSGERHSLRYTLIDDVYAQLGEAIDIAFTRAEVSAFDGIVEKPIDTVAVVLIILGGVDPTLRGDAVCAAWGILKAEALYFVAQLAHRRRRRCTRQARAHHDDGVFPLVGWIHQLHFEAVPVPLLRQRTAWDVRIEVERHRTSPLKTATGTAVKAAQIRIASAMETR